MKSCSVVTTGELSTDHVAALERLQSEVTIALRCPDLTELLAVVRTGRFDAVLIIGHTDQLAASIVAQLQEDTSAVVVISDLASERSRISRLGLTTFDDTVPADQLAGALRAGGSGTGDETAEFSALMEAEGFLPEPAASQARITAVWGISGAPGRTTLAVNIAAELALTGRRVLLIDADSYASSVAVCLGLLEESAGIAQVCRAAEFGTLDSEALLRATVEVQICGVSCDVLTGLPRVSRWTELRPRALERVLTLSRERYDHIVTDIGSEISPDQDIGFDQPAVSRNSAAQTVLAAADRVIAVGAPDPVGFTRLTKAVQLYAEVLPEAAAPEVVINKVRKQVVGRSPRRQLDETWSEVGHGAAIAAFLPWEPEACDAALRDGQVLAEAAADSPLRQQIAALTGIQVPRRRRGFRRHRTEDHHRDRGRM